MLLWWGIHIIVVTTTGRMCNTPGYFELGLMFCFRVNLLAVRKYSYDTANKNNFYKTKGEV